MARVDRRAFLKLSALAALPRAGSHDDPVVIVGAGLAGMRAAQLLRAAKRTVVVLEAKGSAGGRVRTLRAPFSAGLYGEAGPIRIAPMHTTVLQLAREYGLSLVPFASSNGTALASINGVSGRSPDDLKDLTASLDMHPDERGLGQGALLERYLQGLPADLSDPNPTPASYAQWEAYDRLAWPDWLRSRGASPGAIALMTLGGDSKGLSALYLLRQQALLKKTSQFYKIHGGMDLLPRAMAASLGGIVRYNAPVVRLDQREGAVRIDFLQASRMKSIRASRVILAVPFSTLRHVEVQPPFSGPKAQAIADLPYFPATRFLLQTKSRFWHTGGLSGSARTDQPAELWDCAYDLPGTRGILGATVGGDIGGSLAGAGRDEVSRFGVDLVAKVFPAIRGEYEKSVAYRWTEDPWSRGGFAVFRPGQMASMMPGIDRPEVRVHFAGEHTSSWMGWMEGALQSGERAAQEVMHSMEARSVQ